MGYDYVGTDASEGLIKIAQSRNPTANFKHMSVHNLDFPQNEFDGFLAAAVLLHTPKDRIKAALDRIRAVIKSNG